MKPLLIAYLICLLPLLFCAGCALRSEARAKSAETITANHESTITRSLRGDMVPNVSVSGTNNSVRVGSFPVETTLEVFDKSTTKGAADNASTRSFSWSFSVWIALAGTILAISFGLLSWVLYSKLTATGAASDKAVGSIIEAHEHGISGDKLKSFMEKVRGKLR